MTKTDINELITPDPSRGDRFGFDGEPAEEQHGEAAQRLVRSLRRRWWFYLLVAILAGGGGYYLAQEYGTYTYTAQGIVGGNRVPEPPGRSFYTPPPLDSFGRYLGHPEVAQQLRDEFGVLEEDGQIDLNFVTEQYDRKRDIVIVKSTRDDAEEAAAIVNQAIQIAIAKSVDERKEILADLLSYYSGLVGKAEADAASKRLSKAERLSALQSRYANSRETEIEFEEITREYRARRQRVEDLKAQVVQQQRLKSLLESNQKELIGRIRETLLDQIRVDLKETAERFAPDSGQAKEIGKKQAEIDKLAAQDVTSRQELYDLLGEAFRVAGNGYAMPPEDTARLRQISDELYQLGNQLTLLPQQIEDAEAAFQTVRDQRAQMRPIAEQDFENSPEIIELTAQIAWAEKNADSIASAVAWVKDMQTQETPAFQAILAASPGRAAPKGDHKKLFALAFVGISALLAMPLLIWDLSHSEKSPSQRLCDEFGLSPISTQALEGGRLAAASGLQPNDPELRLLALRIQRSAREARGSVVLFSSLADSVSTKELTTTIASCLAAREERVMIVDLEPIDEHRQGNRLTLAAPAAGADDPVSDFGQLDIPATDQLAADQPAADQPATDQSANGHAAIGQPANGHAANGRGANGRGPDGLATAGKMGLALALAGGTKDTDDVLVERGSDGIDRLQLGDGELPVEAFASPLMTRLLDRYRNEYSMVLLSGPAAKHIADVQMLASRCDGTLFVAPSKGAISPVARRTILDLIENRAPIMGIAQLPA